MTGRKDEIQESESSAFETPKVEENFIFFWFVL